MQEGCGFALIPAKTALKEHWLGREGEMEGEEKEEERMERGEGERGR